MKRIKSFSLFLLVCCVLVLTVMSCFYSTPPQEYLDMFGINSDAVVGQFDVIRKRLEHAGFDYRGVVYQPPHLSIPDTEMQEFVSVYSRASIVVGPTKDVRRVGISCSFDNPSCLEYLADLMSAFGFDLNLLEQAKKEFKDGPYDRWYKWYNSRHVKGYLEKNPKGIGITITNKKYLKKK